MCACVCILWPSSQPFNPRYTTPPPAAIDIFVGGGGGGVVCVCVCVFVTVQSTPLNPQHTPKHTQTPNPTSFLVLSPRTSSSSALARFSSSPCAAPALPSSSYIRWCAGGVVAQCWHRGKRPCLRTPNKSTRTSTYIHIQKHTYLPHRRKRLGVRRRRLSPLRGQRLRRPARRPELRLSCFFVGGCVWAKGREGEGGVREGG